jgi:hypothetical protein
MPTNNAEQLSQFTFGEARKCRRKSRIAIRLSATENSIQILELKGTQTQVNLQRIKFALSFQGEMNK